MGFLDKLKKKAPQLKQRAAHIAAGHNAAIDRGIDQAADLAGKATKGKHNSAIDGAADKAKHAADRLAENDKP